VKLSSYKARRGQKVELAMTSMIDVVFLLLIFFMTTTTFLRTEKSLESAIQVQERSAAQARSDFEPAIVDVAPGTAAPFVFRLGTREILAAEELTNVLAQFENKADGAYVRVSDEAPFGMAAAAINACKRAGFFVHYVPLERGN
jgi:biopolymer transport protein ExbD